MNRITENSCSSHAEGGDRQGEGVVLLVLDELLHRPVGIVERVDRLLGVDVEAERVVEEPHGVD